MADPDLTRRHSMTARSLMYTLAAFAFAVVWNHMDPDESGELRWIMGAVTLTFAGWAVVAFVYVNMVGFPKRGRYNDETAGHPEG
jgi:hypothetical protein